MIKDLPNKQYKIIYADPPWSYRQGGRGAAKNHYRTMTTEEISAMPVQRLCDAGGAVLFMWATFPNIGAAIKVMEAWGFVYKTAAFVWAKKCSKSGKNFVGMGAYTRANAEVCLLGVTPGIKAMDIVKNHGIRQIVEAPVQRHSKKPDEVRRRIVALLGDAPRIELFARERADGWDAWGEEV